MEACWVGKHQHTYMACSRYCGTWRGRAAPPPCTSDSCQCSPVHVHAGRSARNTHHDMGHSICCPRTTCCGTCRPGVRTSEKGSRHEERKRRVCLLERISTEWHAKDRVRVRSLTTNYSSASGYWLNIASRASSAFTLRSWRRRTGGMSDFVVDSDPEDGLLHMFSPLSGPSASTRHSTPPCAKRQRGSDSAGAACAASSATAPAASGGAHHPTQ